MRSKGRVKMFRFSDCELDPRGATAKRRKGRELTNWTRQLYGRRQIDIHAIVLYWSDKVEVEYN